LLTPGKVKEIMGNFLKTHINWRSAAVLICIFVYVLGSAECHAQRRNRKKEEKTVAAVNVAPTVDSTGRPLVYLHYKVINGDTVYVETLRPSRCYSRLPRQKSKEWRKYYRLVHNFARTYPYALASKRILLSVDSTMVAEGMKRGKKDKYINQVQKELFKVFEEPMRSMTVTQGALLMKLIDREIGKTSFKIIKDYKNGIAAGFWQGIAKMFGSDMKKPYDPDGDDKQTEELVKLWEEGEFDLLYFAIFMKEPPRANIPEKYR
jgi:hypothetical protein